MRARFCSWPWRPELLVLTALAALTRFWGLFSPHAVVFDEVHYEKFVAEYLAHVFYVDVHPPLANQIFALAARLFHVSIATLAHPDPAPVLRIVPALAGTLIIPVFYLLLRRLGATRALATLGAALLMCDNALLVESRVLVPDSMLVLFGLSAVTVFLLARGRVGRARAWRLVVAALLAGLAVSIKWTGLSALGLIGLIWAVDVRRARMPWRRWTLEGAQLLAIPLALYMSVFAVHFAWMTHSGPGDMWMSPQFRATLVADQKYQPDAHMSFAAKFVELNVVMRRADAFLVGGKKGESSSWYTWPLIEHAISFWAAPADADGRRATIFLAGNPVIWYGIPIALLAAAVGWARRPERFAPWRKPLAILGAAYAINFLPFAAIERIMYQYSYFMAFVFSLALAVLGIGVAAGFPAAAVADNTRLWTFPSRRVAAAYWGVLALAVISFLYYAPVSYGWPLSPAAFDQRFWFVERHF